LLTYLLQFYCNTDTVMLDPTKNNDHNLAVQITFLLGIAVCI